MSSDDASQLWWKHLQNEARTGPWTGPDSLHALRKCRYLFGLLSVALKYSYTLWQHVCISSNLSLCGSSVSLGKMPPRPRRYESSGSEVIGSVPRQENDVLDHRVVIGEGLHTFLWEPACYFLKTHIDYRLPFLSFRSFANRLD